MTAPPVLPMLLLALAGLWEITVHCQRRRIPVHGGGRGLQDVAGWLGGLCGKHTRLLGWRGPAPSRGA